MQYIHKYNKTANMTQQGHVTKCSAQKVAVHQLMAKSTDLQGTTSWGNNKVQYTKYISQKRKYLARHAFWFRCGRFVELFSSPLAFSKTAGSNTFVSSAGSNTLFFCLFFHLFMIIGSVRSEGWAQPRSPTCMSTSHRHTRAQAHEHM